MSFRIGHFDSLTTQRLKLIYLIPISLLCLIPWGLWYGFKEFPEELSSGIKEIWGIINGTVKINHKRVINEK